MFVIACPQCGAKNRVDDARLDHLIPKCGRCGANLAPPSTPTAPATPSHPISISEKNFEDEVLKAGDRPVLVDCWADWCGPCRMIDPMIKKLAEESAGRFRVTKLNVDENQRLAMQFRIESIPTLLIFKKGNLVNRLVGVQPKDAVLNALKKA